MSNVSARSIVDDVAYENKHRNPELFEQILNNPGYYGKVKTGYDTLALTPAIGAKNIKMRSLISSIIGSANSLQLSSEEQAQVVVLFNGGTVSKNTHPKIIAFIKSCIVGSASACDSYARVLSDFAKALMMCADNITLPINVPVSTKLEEVLLEELNEYLAELCSGCDVESHEVIVPDKKSIAKMLKDAEG